MKSGKFDTCKNALYDCLKNSQALCYVSDYFLKPTHNIVVYVRAFDSTRFLDSRQPPFHQRQGKIFNSCTERLIKKNSLVIQNLDF